jgi:hypothetical protein
MPRPTHAAFLILTDLEPRLLRLLADIKTVRAEARGRKHSCANRHWYGGFKKRLCALVGFDARGAEPALRGSDAYDTAYRYLCDCLPNCRGCWCAGVDPCEGCEECTRAPARVAPLTS